MFLPFIIHIDRSSHSQKKVSNCAFSVNIMFIFVYVKQTKTEIMKAIQFNYRGTTINKVQFSEIEDILQEKGFNVDVCFDRIADENEFVYVSNGFIYGLKNENNDTEWHHFFKKDADGEFEAFKMSFYNQNIEHA